MAENNIKTVPNQRIISVNKEPTNKENIYTTNNLSALDEAAGLLQSKAGFKLYMYLAKNQNNRTFALSSAAFISWARVGIGAYNSAFNELIEYGYLIKKEGTETVFLFYDKSQNQAKRTEKDEVVIEYPEVDKSKEFTF